MASRSAAQSIRSWRRSSLCTSGLFLLAGDADPGPRDRVQTRFGNRFSAVAADAVNAFVDAAQRLFDRLQNFGVGLLQLQLNVNLVRSARLIRHVALAP